MVMLRVRPKSLAVAVVLIGFCLPASSGEPPEPGSVVPLADLLGQVDFFVERVEESLADPAAFDLAKQSRTEKDANTLAALALALSAHADAFPEKSSMPALLAAAQRLAVVEADAQAGQQALMQIQQARAGKLPGGELEGGANVASLMKQVPLVHTRLKRGTRPGRLDRRPEESAGQAATLAAMAEAALLDDQYAQSAEDTAAWAELCRAMRDAAGEVNSAIHAQDQARVTAGMNRMEQSCEACHARFRVP